MLRTDNGTCSELRVVLTSVAETPVKVSGLEDLAIGKKLGEEQIDIIADMAATQTQPIEDHRGSAWYKREMVEVHVRRGIETLMEEG